MSDFECKYCKKSFYSKYTLRTHELKNCKNKKTCEFCLESFVKDGNYNNHQCALSQTSVLQNRIRVLENQVQTLLEEKQHLLEQQNQTLQEERNRLVDLLASREPVVNNITNNNNVVTFNTYFSDQVPVVTQNDIDNSLEHLSDVYLLQGPIGIAKFLCQYPYKEKFITTDKSRKIIMHNTEYKNLYKDEKCKWMIYTFLRSHCDAIIEKCLSLLSEETLTDITELNTQVTQNILLNQTIILTQHAKKGSASEYDEELSLFITEQGLCNKRVLEHRYSSL